MKLQEPTCFDCPHNLHYSSAIPIKQYGVTMHLGEHYCIGSKRARRFRRSDPKNKVPGWCPKRKKPHVLRIYGFKDTESWLMHEELCHALNREISPEGHRYAVEADLTTDLTPKEFLERSAVEPEMNFLGVDVRIHSVVEIDDGLVPVYLYKTAEGYRNEPFFNSKLAKANQIISREDAI